jgi:hypothetical protein
MDYLLLVWSRGLLITFCWRGAAFNESASFHLQELARRGCGLRWGRGAAGQASGHTLAEPIGESFLLHILKITIFPRILDTL